MGATLLNARNVALTFSPPCCWVSRSTRSILLSEVTRPGRAITQSNRGYPVAQNAMIITNDTEIHLDFLDRVKALFGKTIHLRVEIETTTETEIVSTHAACNVAPIFPRSRQGRLVSLSDET